MKTIMFYINNIFGGGAERVITQLANQFADHGYDAILVTSFRGQDEFYLNGKVIRLSMEEEEIKQSKITRNISRIKKMRNYLRQYKPEVLVSFMAEPNFRSIVASMGLPVKTIVSVRNDPNKEYGGKFLGHFVGKYVLPMADGCVFQTEDAKTWFSKKLQERSCVILNPVDEDFINTDRVEISNNVVTLGRLSSQKNHRLLINAFRLVSEKYSNLNLLIYGVGPLKDELLELINSYQLQNRIKLMGQTNNSAKVLSESKMFVLSSDFEGMPNCLMEALAVGVPSISTDCPCGGPRMLIKDHENGLLVPVGDEKKIAAAITEMIENQELAESMGRTAKLFAQRFHPETIYQEWKEYVEEVAKS